MRRRPGLATEFNGRAVPAVFRCASFLDLPGGDLDDVDGVAHHISGALVAHRHFSASAMPLRTTRDKLPEMPTQRGHTEKRGARGDRGPAGPTGPRGPAGPVMAPADILAVVEDQFYDVRKRLDAQLTRTAEVQQQLEGQRKEIAELRRTVNLAHRLLKELLAKIP